MVHRFRMPRVGLAAFVAATVVASVSSADVLHLKKGGRLEGVLIAETPSSLTIDVGIGQVSVPRASVARIERGESALSEYRNRLALIEPGDVLAYVDLARLAERGSLRSEAQRMWARVLSLDPRNVEAHLALGHVLVGGTYVDEAEANRASGLVYFDGRWMTPVEQTYLLRQRERRAMDEREDARALRASRDAEDRARFAEAAASRARAAASASTLGGFPIYGYPAWGGHGSNLSFGSLGFGGYGGGCINGSCSAGAQFHPVPRAPAPSPRPRRAPPRPSSIW